MYLPRFTHQIKKLKKNIILSLYYNILMNLLQIMIIAAIVALAGTFGNVQNILSLMLRILTIYIFTTFFATMLSPPDYDDNIYARNRNRYR
jgi:membrane protein implicated in regulation of membrane protease activity